MKRLFVVLFILGSLAAAWLMYLNVNNYQPPTDDPRRVISNKETSAAPTPREKLSEIVEAYHTLHQHQIDRYWLKGGELENSGPAEHFGRMNTFKQSAVNGLRRYVDADNLTHEILGEFKDFRLSEVMRGPNGGFFSSDLFTINETVTDVKAAIEARSGLLEMSVIPESNWERSAFPSALYYKTDWRAVMVVGIEMPDLFRTALLYHELGHALFHKRGAPSATAHPTSDSWVEEEAAMHLLEHRVLDYGSNGEFNKLLDSIADRAANPRDVNQVILAVTGGDLATYDRLFKLEAAGPEVSALSLSQFVLSLGFRVIERRQADPEIAMKEMGLYYRFIAGK